MKAGTIGWFINMRVCLYAPGSNFRIGSFSKPRLGKKPIGNFSERQALPALVILSQHILLTGVSALGIIVP